MNRRQQIVLFVIVVAFVATWLFPPWILHKEPGSDNLGYRFLFTWAQQGGPLGQYLFTIDWGRLFLADLMIAASGGWLLYALRSKS